MLFINQYIYIHINIIIINKKIKLKNIEMIQKTRKKKNSKTKYFIWKFKDKN